jgi:hypothetical protein
LFALAMAGTIGGRGGLHERMDCLTGDVSGGELAGGLSLSNFGSLCPIPAPRAQAQPPDLGQFF